jgi:hypothetical protein
MNPQGFTSTQTLLISPVPIHLYLTVKMTLHNSSTTMLRSLYNSGTKINIVNQGTVDCFGLNYSLFHFKLVATFIDCNQLRLGKSYQLTLCCQNSASKEKLVGQQRV